jgi:uncharacterized protein YqjF (DUF2071 family)
MGKIFLAAEWKNLIMANYVVEADVLQPYLPNKTDLDTFNGKIFVSLVGFLFANTKVLGVKFPFHVNFEEVNLRFYVKHLVNGEGRRGVVFIKEIVPKVAISLIANTLYREKYCSMPMSSSFKHETELEVSYKWKFNRKWHCIEAVAKPIAIPTVSGSEEEFIAEHYYGYSRFNGVKTYEYKVSHPRWNVYPVKTYRVDCDFEALYGKAFAFLKYAIPSSVFLAEGSAITVSDKRSLGT